MAARAAKVPNVAICGHVLLTVFVPNIPKDFIAPASAEVYVNIRHGDAALGSRIFQKEDHTLGIHISYTGQVSY